MKSEVIHAHILKVSHLERFGAESGIDISCSQASLDVCQVDINTVLRLLMMSCLPVSIPSALHVLHLFHPLLRSLWGSPDVLVNTFMS